MLDSLKTFLSQLKEPEQSEQRHSIELAAATLIVEMCKADSVTDLSELRMAANTLQDMFGIESEQIENLLTDASAQSNQATSTHEFTRVINEHFSDEEKVQLIEVLWQVAYADGRLDKLEEHLVRKIAELIYVSHSDFIRAKLTVKEALRISGELD